MTRTAPEPTQAIAAAYVQLCEFQRGQEVMVDGPAGRQRGTVTVPLRYFTSDIGHAFLVIGTYARRNRVRVIDILTGKYQITPKSSDADLAVALVA